MNKFYVAGMSAALALAFFVAPDVRAVASDPTGCGTSRFYANGTPITLTDNAGGVTITWGSGSCSYNATDAAALHLYGGYASSDANASDLDSTNITVNGGTMNIIYGGSHSVDANSYKVGTVNITMNGGVLNRIYGGSVGDNALMSVGTVNVNLPGGTLQRVIAGGMMNTTVGETNLNISGADIAEVAVGGGYSNSASVISRVTTSNVKMTAGSIDTLGGGGQGNTRVGTSNVVVTGGTVDGWGVAGGGIMLTSGIGLYTNVVDNANVTIGSGVTTVLAADGPNAVGGGSSVDANVGRSSISIAGGDWHSALASGVNGVNGDAQLDITGGTFVGVAGLSRGDVEDVVINIYGGTITDLYAGASPSSNADGTIDSVQLNVYGGKVTNASIGYDGTGSLDRDAATQDTVVLSYVTGAIENEPTTFSDDNTGIFVYINGTPYLADPDKALNSNSWFAALTLKDGYTFVKLVDANSADFAADTIITQTVSLTLVFEEVVNPNTSDGGIVIASVAGMSLFGLGALVVYGKRFI